MEKLELFNKTTTFLTKFLFQENLDILKKVGFIDSYTSDPSIMEILTLGKDQRFLFILFKNKKLTLEDLKKVVNDLSKLPIQTVFAYELINDYAMVVIDFPEKYIKDYDNLVEGKYSKLSFDFKDTFPMTIDVFNENKQRIGKEYTIYYHIFNKTDWLKNFWMERFALMELDDKLELWEKPNSKDLNFNIKNIE